MDIDKIFKQILLHLNDVEIDELIKKIQEHCNYRTSNKEIILYDAINLVSGYELFPGLNLAWGQPYSNIYMFIKNDKCHFQIRNDGNMLYVKGKSFASKLIKKHSITHTNADNIILTAFNFVYNTNCTQTMNAHQKWVWSQICIKTTQ